MDIIFSEEFKKEYQKIRDEGTRLRIIKIVKKIANEPTIGKPLKHELKNHRRVRIKPFRLIYRIDGNTLIVNWFEHRKTVYE